jgi:hypothetical protein
MKGFKVVSYISSPSPKLCLAQLHRPPARRDFAKAQRSCTAALRIVVFSSDVDSAAAYAVNPMETGRSLGAFQPVPAQQPIAGTRDHLKPTARQVELWDGAVERSNDTAWGGTALAAYYRSLADAILDCQSKLESVNWKRWCQDYF